MNVAHPSQRQKPVAEISVSPRFAQTAFRHYGLSNSLNSNVQQVKKEKSTANKKEKMAAVPNGKPTQPKKTQTSNSNAKPQAKTETEKKIAAKPAPRTPEERGCDVTKESKQSSSLKGTYVLVPALK